MDWPLQNGKATACAHNCGQGLFCVGGVTTHVPSNLCNACPAIVVDPFWPKVIVVGKGVGVDPLRPCRLWKLLDPLPPTAGNPHGWNVTGTCRNRDMHAPHANGDMCYTTLMRTTCAYVEAPVSCVFQSGAAVGWAPNVNVDHPAIASIKCKAILAALFPSGLHVGNGRLDGSNVGVGTAGRRKVDPKHLVLEAAPVCIPTIMLSDAPSCSIALISVHRRWTPRGFQYPSTSQRSGPHC